MGSVPSSLTGNRSKTAVQQICIDQNSGQVHHKRDGSSKTNRRLSAAVELASGRLKTAMKGRRMAAITELAGSSSSRHCPQQFPEMQEVVDSLRRRLCDCEATKNELEMRLRAVEKEKRELELAWARNSEMPGSTLASGLPSQEEFGKPTCQCRNWEEQLTQRLWERDQVWTRRLAEEVARRRSLLKALEWQIGTQAMDRLLAMLESQSPTFSAEHPNAECRLELANVTEIPLNQSQSTNGHPKEENAPESLPSARLSTASTMQSTNNEQQQQHMTAKFRSSRRNLTGTDGKAPSLDLDGICLAGPLAEEFEFEEGQQHPANGQHIVEQRRASTSAKSRDSGISY